MNTIQTAIEPLDASLVSKELDKSLLGMKLSLSALSTQNEDHDVMSTPVLGHVFFVRNDRLLCVPTDFVFQGTIEPSLELEACTPEDMDLCVGTQKALIEAIDEWVSRPVYTKTSIPKSTA